TGGTNVAPDGRLRYSLGISTYLYRERGLWRSSDSESFSFPKYAIVGVVRDTAGNPLEGAAIDIGNQVVYSNETGEFLLRFRKRSSVPFRVEVNEFLIAGSFEVVTAPSSVMPGLEENGEKIEVVV